MITTQVNNTKLSQQQPNNPMQKSQRLILQFNKNGLQALKNEKTHAQALDYLKKAQNIVLDELKIQPGNMKLNQLAGVTYNNLACYYKKTNKPKVSLTYLKKALQIEVFKVQNWLSTASTHLNISAIYSYMNKHQQACEQAFLAMKMIEKWEVEQLDKKQPEEEIKTYRNVKMLSNYNAAIELQHLKKYQESLKYYQLTIDTGSQYLPKDAPILKKCHQAYERVKDDDKDHKQKLIQLVSKRKEHQKKNNYEFMRKNKKNFPKDGQGWRDIVQNRKYAEYKINTQNNSKSQLNVIKHHSVSRLAAIHPVMHGGNSARYTQSQNSTMLMKKIPEQ